MPYAQGAVVDISLFEVTKAAETKIRSTQRKILRITMRSQRKVVKQDGAEVLV